MAGKYITIVNPGYSTLFTRDLKYDPNTTWDGSDPSNPFDPDSAIPLLEGEWLVPVASNKVTREGSQNAGTATQSSVTAPGYNLGREAAYLHFNERGRYDAQITKKTHLISGPGGFEFRTKLCKCAAGDEGELVVVADMAHPNQAGQYVRALYSASALNAAASFTALVKTRVFVVGTVARVYGTDDMLVRYNPGFITLVDANTIPV